MIQTCKSFKSAGLFQAALLCVFDRYVLGLEPWRSFDLLLLFMIQKNIFESIKQQTILNWEDESKTLYLLVEVQEEDVLSSGIVILRKQPFEKQAEKYSFNQDGLKCFFNNDIYTKYSLTMQDEIEIEIIYPAQKKHIEKYSRSEIVIVNESYEMYKQQAEIAKPISLTWLENIFKGVSEQESILFSCDEFILLKDYNFTTTNLHLLVIPRNPRIKSLRELNDTHLLLLEQMLKQSLETMEQTFKVGSDKLKHYIHYPPTFPHFHIHIAHVSQQRDSLRDHLLHQVMQNIKLVPNYYQTVELQYSIKKSIVME